MDSIDIIESQGAKKAHVCSTQSVYTIHTFEMLQK